eukprot:SAG31_NODE_9837_length_1221_cov_2.360963_3_plen_152_part_01
MALLCSGLLHAIDYSPTVISQLKQRLPAPVDISCSVMDVRHMPLFADGSFDVVLEKATFDALESAPGSEAILDATLREVDRVLKPGGVLLSFSAHDPLDDNEVSAFIQLSVQQKSSEKTSMDVFLGRPRSMEHATYLARVPMPLVLGSKWAE